MTLFLTIMFGLWSPTVIALSVIRFIKAKSKNERIKFASVGILWIVLIVIFAYYKLN